MKQTMNSPLQKSCASERVVSKILHEAQYSTLVKRAQQLAQLTDSVRAVLPAVVQKHCRVANVIRSTLVLYISSGTWHMQVHFLLPQLLKAVQAEPDFSHITDINLKVRPERVAAPAAPTPTPRALSTEARSMIRNTAKHIRDPQLREALERLGQRTNGSPLKAT